MDKLVFGFIACIFLFLAYVLNTDISSDDGQEKSNIAISQSVENKIKKTPSDIKIEYEKKNIKPLEQKVKKQFDTYIASNVDDMHTVSTTKVNGYKVSIKTLTPPVVNKFAPPSFPTIVSGELNGNKFHLTIDDNAKKEAMYLTITKNSQTAVISVDSLQDTSGGQIVDIGNLNPPENLDSTSVSEFENESSQIIEQSVETSTNSSDKSSIAPPSPPSIGG